MHKHIFKRPKEKLKKKKSYSMFGIVSWPWLAGFKLVYFKLYFFIL